MKIYVSAGRRGRYCWDMAFHSYAFIFIFLPLSLLIYAGLCRLGGAWGRLGLTVASLVFYGIWDIRYVPLLLVATLVNFGLGRLLAWRGRPVLIAGIVFNLGILAWFKYAGFFQGNSEAGPLLQVILPVGLSFMVFRHISYLVDCYRGTSPEKNPLDFLLFSAFFPYLIAGPLARYREVMDQFSAPDARGVATGLFVFSIGLAKKAVADLFAVWADYGFDIAAAPNFFESWGASLSYTLQIYYDFSGYTDMAVGAALLFGVRLPVNFNSPYRATTIQEFWRRWHMTLGRFMRDYVYIPLGGSRGGMVRTCALLLFVFLLIGIWHGAAWTFVAWGVLHGVAQVCHRLWRQAGGRMNPVAGWLLTFCFINAAWVLFRADGFDGALKIYRGMAGLNGVALPEILHPVLGWLAAYGVDFGMWMDQIGGSLATLAWIGVFLLMAVAAPNSVVWQERFRPAPAYAVAAGVLLAYGLMSVTRVTLFIYSSF